MIEERRILKRAPVKIIANCAINRDISAPDEFLAFTKDISSQGAHLIVSKEIDADQRLRVRLEMPDYFIPLLTYSEVVWRKKVDLLKDKNKIFLEVGIKFLNMDKIDNEKLENFFKDRLQPWTMKSPLENAKHALKDKPRLQS